MLHNFPELVVTLDLYYRKIPAIRTAIKYAEWRSDFKKIAALKTKEELIRKKIKSCIAFYKTQMADRYLENRIYSQQLSELETYFDKLFEDFSDESLWRQ